MLDVSEAAWGGAILWARGDRLSDVNRPEDGLDVVEDGRFGDLLNVVREEGLGAGTKGAVGGAVGADVPAGPSGEADALLLPVASDAATTIQVILLWENILTTKPLLHCCAA